MSSSDRRRHFPMLHRLDLCIRFYLNCVDNKWYCGQKCTCCTFFSFKPQKCHCFSSNSICNSKKKFMEELLLHLSHWVTTKVHLSEIYVFFSGRKANGLKLEAFSAWQREVGCLQQRAVCECIHDDLRGNCCYLQFVIGRSCSWSLNGPAREQGCRCQEIKN